MNKKDNHHPQNSTSQENASGVPAPSKPEIALRIALISDMHVDPDEILMTGFTKALRDIKARQPSIDLIINAGDCVFNALDGSDEYVQSAWDAFNTVLKKECTLPIYHTIGNHDVRGWSLPAEEQKNVPAELFGKGQAIRELGLTNRYYTFDNAGWRFLILDSANQPDENCSGVGHSYIGQIDEEQFHWLRLQLESTPPDMPVCIVSHIPIFSACVYLDGKNEVNGKWVVTGAWMHIDARRLWRLFWQHRNVKLCLSGHTHQVEDLRYHGVNYVNNGAICGNWWDIEEPAFLDVPSGYTLINFYKDGSWESQYVTY